MKQFSKLTLSVVALGFGAFVSTGVAHAADMKMMPMQQGMMMQQGQMMDMKPNTMMMDQGMMMKSMPMSDAEMAKMGTWNGIGSVMPNNMPSSQVDYKGAVTTFQSMYPGAQITSISYDAKHNPMYEVEGFMNGQKMEMKMLASGELMNTEVKMMDMKKSHMDKKMMKHGSMMYGMAMPSKESRMMAKAFNINDIIIPEMAETKAQDKIGGQYQVMDWTVEKEHGRLMYDLDMIDGSGREADVHVDAMTGEVIKVSMKKTKF